MVERRRPNRSTNIKAGIEEAKIRIAETPEARNDALEEDKPAC
jgi:hypothetical protein